MKKFLFKSDLLNQQENKLTMASSIPPILPQDVEPLASQVGGHTKDKDKLSPGKVEEQLRVNGVCHIKVFLQ